MNENYSNNDKIFEVYLDKRYVEIDMIVVESLRVLNSLGREVSFLGFDKYDVPISLIDGVKYGCVRGASKIGCARFSKTDSNVLEFKNRKRVVEIRNMIER